MPEQKDSGILQRRAEAYKKYRSNYLKSKIERGDFLPSPMRKSFSMTDVRIVSGLQAGELGRVSREIRRSYNDLRMEAQIKINRAKRKDHIQRIRERVVKKYGLDQKKRNPSIVERVRNFFKKT